MVKLIRAQKLYLLFGVLGYITSVCLIGLMPFTESSYLQNVLRAGLYLSGPFVIMLYLGSKWPFPKVAKAPSRGKAVLWGIITASLVGTLTAFTTYLIYRLLFDTDPGTQGSHILVESLLFLYGGFVYTLLGSVVFGGLMGYLIHSPVMAPSKRT